MLKREAVIDALEIWLDVGYVQGYRDGGLPADKSFIPTADLPFDLDDTCLRGASGIRVLFEGCYDILVNVLIRLHVTTPIKFLEIM